MRSFSSAVDAGEIIPEAGKEDEVCLWEDEHPWAPYLLNAIKAEHLFLRDRDYIVTADKEIKIVNTATGRILPISRWSDGIHQVGMMLKAGCSACGGRSFWQWASRRVMPLVCCRQLSAALACVRGMTACLVCQLDYLTSARGSTQNLAAHNLIACKAQPQCQGIN